MLSSYVGLRAEAPDCAPALKAPYLAAVIAWSKNSLPISFEKSG